uniref:15-hydroxyprostaglandin dehydrogenase [NAD(+)] n=2 Tax=Astyanax mexicanus TaxID=7994 RepID=A0A8B9GUQ6_ASTMX
MVFGKFEQAGSLWIMALNGKVAVVTGAAQGLGKGFVEILLQNGANVALLDLNEKAGKDLEENLNKAYGADRAHFYTADVSSEQQFKDAFQKVLTKFGRVDIFCNNAGIVNEKNWEKTVSINLCAVVRGTYLALEHMKKENGGQGGVIVNVASLAGLGPLPSAPIYTATKHGVVGFSRALSMASQLANYGVRINVLCPTFVRTALIDTFHSEELTGQFFNLKTVTESLLDKHPLVEVEDVAKGFLLLVKDESLNGAVLAVRSTGTGIVSFPTEIPKTPVSL